MAQLAIDPNTYALVDDEDLARANMRKWHVRGSKGRKYVATKFMVDGKPQITYLQHFILQTDGERIKFINDDALDCRKNNLRVGPPAPDKPTGKGALGEALTIADLAKHGHEVFVPVSGHTAADLISVDPSGKALRWQVKFRTRTPGTSALRIRLSAVQPRGREYFHRPYDRNAIDGFAVCCADTFNIYYVPVDAIDWNQKDFSIYIGVKRRHDVTRDGRDYRNPNFSDTLRVTRQGSE